MKRTKNDLLANLVASESKHSLSNEEIAWEEARIHELMAATNMTLEMATEMAGQEVRNFKGKPLPNIVRQEPEFDEPSVESISVPTEEAKRMSEIERTNKMKLALEGKKLRDVIDRVERAYGIR